MAAVYYNESEMRVALNTIDALRAELVVLRPVARVAVAWECGDAGLPDLRFAVTRLSRTLRARLLEEK